MSRQPVTSADVRAAAAVVREALWPHRDDDWSARAGGLDWTCRDTLAHATEAVRWYSANLVMRTPGPRPYPKRETFEAGPKAWLFVLESSAALLALAVDAAAPEDRGFHFSGMADAEGFGAGGCDETLIHGWDVAQGLGVAYAPPPDLARRVLDRLFPWAAPREGEDPWRVLLWANGRIALPGRDQLAPDWEWHCAPLEEWDGSGPRFAERQPRGDA